jgi:hypothetical protein
VLNNFKSATLPLSAEGEHIFPASQLTPLAVKWKDLYAQGRHKEAMQVLEQIVEGSTAMFERMAQYEDFHHTVDLPILVSAAQEKVVKWLIKWQPRKGRLFSWFNKCAKHAFLSELVKVNQYRKRFYVADKDSLERFYGSEDHEIDKLDLAKEMNQRLHQIFVRWGDPQEQGAIRFLVECIVDNDDHDKAAAIRSAAYAYGISFELSKFFYSWANVALRHAFHDKIHVPFTEQDLRRAALSYELIVDMYDYFPAKEVDRFIVDHHGQRFKIPTLTFLAKLRENYAIFKEIDASDQDPDTVTEIARRYKRTVRSAQEIFTDMVHTLNPERIGEYELYGDDEPLGQSN